MFDNVKLPHWLGWAAFSVAGLYFLAKVGFAFAWLLNVQGADRYEPAIGLLDIGLGILMVIAGAGLRQTGEFTRLARILDKRIRSHVTEEHDKTRKLILQNHPANVLPDSLKLASQAVKNAYLALDGASAVNRKEAVSTLVESDDPKAIAALELAVKHSTKSVRIEAALALAEKTDGKNEHALSGLLEALDGDDIDTKDHALKSIWQIFFETPSSVSSRAIEKLINVLSDMDVDIRWTAEDVLISQCPITFPYLIEAINHDSSSVKIAALEAIWIISANGILPRDQLLTAVPTLIEALREHYQSVTPRDRAYTSVSKLAEKILIVLSPVEELSAYLQNDRTWMHKDVMRVLDRIKNPNAN